MNCGCLTNLVIACIVHYLLDPQVFYCFFFTYGLFWSLVTALLKHLEKLFSIAHGTDCYRQMSLRESLQQTWMLHSMLTFTL